MTKRILMALLGMFAIPLYSQILISEIRIDQPGTDNDEYFEICNAGLVPVDLSNYTYLVIGDGTAGSGVIEGVVSLSGSIPAGDCWIWTEGTYTLGGTCMNSVTSLNFENSDNVTHLLVEGFTGSDGDDLDTDDDCVLDVTPWTSIIDGVALVETPGSGDCNYSDPNITSIGPDGSNVPGHVFRDDMMNWNIGAFDPAGGDDNPCSAMAAVPVEIKISEIRIDQPGTDNDEYFEICNTGLVPVDLSNLTYVVIGDGTVGSGVIEAVVTLSGSIPAGDCWIWTEGTYTLGGTCMNTVTTLNFENSDNVTHLLVEGFTGSDGDDLDTDDDCVFDVIPWISIIDGVALVETPGSGDCNYSDPNITSVGPDGSNVPGHVYRDDLLNWNIGAFDPSGGDDNPCSLAMTAVPVEVKISEIRIDQPSTDNDEYFEICNTGMVPVDLSNLTYVVIGDGSGGSGVIEAVISLTGSIPAGDCWIWTEGTYTLGGTCMNTVTSLNFENSDNVTHLLVEGFTGSDGDDLDTNDDCILDVIPWTSIIDGVALVETPGSGDCNYSDPSIISVGPDGTFVPGHVYRDDMMNWYIGAFDPVGGEDNPCTLGPAMCNPLDLWEFEILPCTANNSAGTYSVRVVLDSISGVDSASHAVASSIMMGVDSIEYTMGPIPSGEMYYIRFLGSDCMDVLVYQGVVDCDLCGTTMPDPEFSYPDKPILYLQYHIDTIPFFGDRWLL